MSEEGPLGAMMTWRGTMDVDTDKCSGRIVYSTVGMLGETPACTLYRTRLAVVVVVVS